jgi:hypothetical protein
MLKKMNEYQKMKTHRQLEEHSWDWFVTIHQREPDISHQWLLINEAMERLREEDENPPLYWFCFSTSGFSQKPHAHGVIRTSLPRSRVMKLFRECDEPSVKPIETAERLHEYMLRQALETTITNINAEVQQ